MQTRRSFILHSSAALASLFLTDALSLANPTGRKLKNFGFISGIIDKELAGDWKTVLKETVDYGFTEIEIGDYLGDSAGAFLDYCRQIGMRPVAGGINFTTNEDELLKRLDALGQLKVSYAVVYWPWQVGGPFSLDDCKRSAEILNKMGETCKKRDIDLCWHNHNKEFIPMEEGLPFDYLMKHTDSSLVKCEMDIYWVKKGGGDPLELLNKYSGRFAILHVKDMAPGAEKSFECPGSGIINFPSIFRMAQKQGIEHYMVERDQAVDGMACLKTSGEYLRNLTF